MKMLSAKFFFLLVVFTACKFQDNLCSSEPSDAGISAEQNVTELPLMPNVTSPSPIPIPTNYVKIESVPSDAGISAKQNVTELPLMTNVTSPILLHHDCIRDLSVFVGSDTVYISKDNFKTAAKTQIISKQERFEVDRVQRAVLVNNNTVFVAGVRVVLYNIVTKTFRNAAGIRAEGELSDAEITDVSAWHCCEPLSLPWCEKLSKIVVAYNRYINTSILFISKDGGYTFTPEHLPNHFSGRIHAAVVTIAYQSIKILVKEGNEARVLSLGYASRVKPKLFSIPFKVTGDELHMVHMKSEFGSMLIWDEQMLYFTPNGGQTVTKVYLNLHEKSNTSNFFEQGENIRQVISTKDGNFAVLTTKMNLFYGREGFRTEAIPIFDHNVEMTNDTTIAFDASGDILVQTPRTSPSPNKLDPFFKTQTIYIRNIVNRFQPPLRQCPLQVLLGNYHQKTLHIDNGENLTLETTLTKTREANQIIISASNPGVLAIDTTYTKKARHNEFKDTFKTKLIQKAVQLGYHETEGLTSLRTCTVKSSLTCNRNPELVTHVSVGCRPSKNIRVRNTRRRCDYMKNLTYTIPADRYDPYYLDGKALWPKTVTYDYAGLGCPLKVFHMDKVKPIVELWDDNTFVTEVKADYVLYEIHGRNTYSYTLNLANVVCIREPQSWKEMRQRYGSRRAIGMHWTRLNYCSCNSSLLCHEEEEGEEPHSDEDEHGDSHSSEIKAHIAKWESDSTEPYEVLHANLKNEISVQGYNGIYVFELIVVDATYSFCDLRTKFAIEVTGASGDTSVPTLVITGAITVVTLIAIYVTFVSMLENKRAAKKWEIQSQRLKKLKIPNVAKGGKGDADLLEKKEK